ARANDKARAERLDREAEVIGASVLGCYLEVLTQNEADRIDEVREEVTVTTGRALTDDEVAFIYKAAAKGKQKWYASEIFQRYMRIAAIREETGRRELQRLGVQGINCQHPAVVLGNACSNKEMMIKPSECATAEMK